MAQRTTQQNHFVCKKLKLCATQYGPTCLPSMCGKWFHANRFVVVLLLPFCPQRHDRNINNSGHIGPQHHTHSVSKQHLKSGSMHSNYTSRHQTKQPNKIKVAQSCRALSHLHNNMLVDACVYLFIFYLHFFFLSFSIIPFAARLLCCVLCIQTVTLSKLLESTGGLQQQYISLL